MCGAMGSVFIVLVCSCMYWYIHVCLYERPCVCMLGHHVCMWICEGAQYVRTLTSVPFGCLFFLYKGHAASEQITRERSVAADQREAAVAAHTSQVDPFDEEKSAVFMRHVRQYNESLVKKKTCLSFLEQQSCPDIAEWNE